MGSLIFILGLLGLGAYIAVNVAKGNFSGGLLIRSAFILVLLFILASIIGSVLVVRAGHRAVIFDKFAGVKQNALGEGVHVIVPFIQDATIFDIRIQKADVQATAASKDLQDVSTEVVLNFHPNADAVSKIYQVYGKDYEAKVISPAVQEAVKAVVATYTAEQIITKREELKAKVQAQLGEMIEKADLKLDQTYMTNFNFSQGFSQAIEAKQVAEQNALKAERDLQRVRFEADQKLAQAEAEAKGLRLQKDQITPELIQLRKVEMQTKAIEKWDGVLPTQMIPGSSVPFINLESR